MCSVQMSEAATYSEIYKPNQNVWVFSLSQSRNCFGQNPMQPNQLKNGGLQKCVMRPFSTVLFMF